LIPRIPRHFRSPAPPIFCTRYADLSTASLSLFSELRWSALIFQNWLLASLCISCFQVKLFVRVTFSFPPLLLQCLPFSPPLYRTLEYIVVLTLPLILCIPLKPASGINDQLRATPPHSPFLLFPVGGILVPTLPLPQRLLFFNEITDFHSPNQCRR